MPIDIFVNKLELNIPFTPCEYAYKVRNYLSEAFEKDTMNRDTRMIKAKANDRKAFAAKFNLEDRVWVRNDRVEKGECKKLIHHWRGPYRVRCIYNETGRERGADW